jgi:hypothetical protein
MVKIYWNEKLLDLIRKHKFNGLTTKEIAKEIDIPASKIFNACYKYRIILSKEERLERFRLAQKRGIMSKIKNNSQTIWDKDKLNLLRKLKNKNLSNEKIAKIMEVPFKSVCYANTHYQILLSPEERKNKMLEASKKAGKISSNKAMKRGQIKKYDDNLGYIVGVLFGDGSAIDMRDKGCIELRTTNKSFADTFYTTLKKLTNEDPKYHIRIHNKRFEKENREYKNVKYYEVFHNSLYFVRNIVNTFGKTTTKEWRIDQKLITSFGKSFCSALIKGLFDSEGSFSFVKNSNRGELSFSTTNKEGAVNLLSLLEYFGFSFKLNSVFRKNGFYEYKVRTGKKELIKKFYEEIGFSIDYKQDKLKRFVKNIS